MLQLSTKGDGIKYYYGDKRCDILKLYKNGKVDIRITGDIEKMKVDQSAIIEAAHLQELKDQAVAVKVEVVPATDWSFAISEFAVYELVLTVKDFIATVEIFGEPIDFESPDDAIAWLKQNDEEDDYLDVPIDQGVINIVDAVVEEVLAEEVLAEEVLAEEVLAEEVLAEEKEDEEMLSIKKMLATPIASFFQNSADALPEEKRLSMPDAALFLGVKNSPTNIAIAAALKGYRVKMLENKYVLY